MYGLPGRDDTATGSGRRVASTKAAVKQMPAPYALRVLIMAQLLFALLILPAVLL